MCPSGNHRFKNKRALIDWAKEERDQRWNCFAYELIGESKYYMTNPPHGD